MCVFLAGISLCNGGVCHESQARNGPRQLPMGAAASSSLEASAYGQRGAGCQWRGR
eukprot:COSAG01_NODE_75359_length_197_cov_6.307432_1_plen_55_part_10